MRTKSRLTALSLIALLTVLGCGPQVGRAPADVRLALAAAERNAKAQDAPAAQPARAEQPGSWFGKPLANTSAELNRKIIYTAEVKLAVEDFSGLPERVVALVKKFDAYVADSSLSGTTGESRRGSWTIRVPVARFDQFVGATKGLGELIDAGTSSRDVSEEYYDVEARIRNKTKEEARLLKLLDERPGKLEDVIAIERELSRVREEIERMQGRMRVLTNLTSLTTVKLSIVEIRDYEPPEAPTLATQVRRTFEDSLSALESAGESVLLGAIAAVPWLGVFIVGLCPAYFVVRRRRSRKGDRSKPSES